MLKSTTSWLSFMNSNKVKINNELIFRCTPDTFLCRLEERNAVSLCIVPTQHWVGLKSQVPNESCKMQGWAHAFTDEFVGHPLSLCLIWRCSMFEACKQRYVFMCVYHLLIHQSCFNQSSPLLLLTSFTSHFNFCHSLAICLLVFSLVPWQSYKTPRQLFI